MDEDTDSLFDRKDTRKKKDKKRQHKAIKEKEECSRESFKKMKEEIDELRRREIERAKELDILKKKIEEKELNPIESAKTEEEYALEFDKEAYLNKGFIESAIWIKNVLAKNLLEKINKDNHGVRFAALIATKKVSSYLGYRACARFNRGEECSLGKWHLTHKPDGIWTRKHLPEHRQSNNNNSSNNNDIGGMEPQQSKRNELRLHVCTLCLEAFGSANGHNVLNCPWILKKNWNE
jgi:hypothetical protein